MKCRALFCAVLITALLCACNEPVRHNPGRDLSVTTLHDHDMSAVVDRGDDVLRPWDRYVAGVYFHGKPGKIFLLAGEGVAVLAHELAHACDHNGWTFAQGIEAITPADPSPEFAARLAALWDLDRGGSDYWRNIYRRWGRDAVVHPEILARLGIE